MNFKKWVKSIQTAGYNGARTVNKFLVWQKNFGPAQNILGPVKGQGISKNKKQELISQTCTIFFFVLRCQGMVFDAEKRVAKSGSYHKKCFTCIKCKHQLGAGDFTNGPDNEIYCVYCYRVNDSLIRWFSRTLNRRIYECFQRNFLSYVFPWLNF